MQLFPIGRVYDFMGIRRVCFGISLVVVLTSIVLLFYPGPKLGTDFIGGTEVEVAFARPVTPAQVRSAIVAAKFSQPDVIRVQDEANPYRYLIRVSEVSSIDEAHQSVIEKRLCYGEKKPEGCTQHASEVKFSPGGEKITVRFEGPVDLSWVAAQMQGLQGIMLRPGVNNPTLQDVRDNRVEIALMGRGDQLMEGLRAGLEPGAVPESALRMEWIGPKAGAQLRDAALKSIVVTLVFIMVYVAFRFDLRFAPGGVIALIHDSVGTVGILILLGRELNLTTVAAVLTIIGYSINDTVVVYDRMRENLNKLRGSSFATLINISISEMLSRTVLTSGSTIMALSCFFIWGTGTLRDFALTLIIGMLLGVYSSVYVALPLTGYFDTKFVGPKKANA